MSTLLGNLHKFQREVQGENMRISINILADKPGYIGISYIEDDGTPLADWLYQVVPGDPEPEFRLVDSSHETR